MVASHNGHIDTVKMLLEYGVEVALTDKVRKKWDTKLYKLYVSV